MKLRQKSKSGLSTKDRQFIKKKIEAKLSVETLERRELLAADLIGGMADVAEGEDAPKVQMRLQATDLQGQPLEAAFLNQAFNLQGYVTDLRTDAKGVFTSYMDVEFDKSLTQAIGSIVHAADYQNFQSGTIDVSGSVGLIDEVGGMAGLSEMGSGERLVFTVPMRATGAGTIVFDGNHADVKPAHQVLIYGENNEVPEPFITIVDYSLDVSDLGALPYSEDFNDGSADAMTVKQGSFAIENKRYNSTPSDSNQRALAVIDLTVDIPSKTRFQSTINLDYANGRKRNAYQVFAYQDTNNYKIAGLNAEARRWVIGEFNNGQYRELRRSNVDAIQNKNYQLELAIDGQQATLNVDGNAVLSHAFGSNLNVGQFGLLAIGANSRFDDVHISEILPAPIAEGDFGRTLVGQAVTIDVLANDGHEQDGTALHILSVDGVDNGAVELLDNNQDNKADVLVFTPDGGFTGSETFTYLVGDANGQQDRGTVSITVAAALPLEVDFNDSSAVDFSYTESKWRFNGGGFESTDTRGINLATVNLGVELPSKYKVGASQSTQGYLASGFIFDYSDASNYKFARQTSQGYQIGQVASGRTTVLSNIRESINTNNTYALELHVENNLVTFYSNDVSKASVTIDGTLNDGQVGLYTYRSRTQFDDFFVKEIVPTPIAGDDVSQTIVNTPVTIDVLANDSHDVDGTAYSLVSVTDPENGTVSYDASAGTVTYTPADGWRGLAEFSYTVADDDNPTRSDRGTVSITVAAALPLEVDFNDSSAVDFSYTE
ncbi:MAG: cadherin-like domain-containing protein, partial [Planctomycetaceae bacterium]|nr:cadherin-like domain-containing protein [Planctomycetaceae bacterium]